MEGEPKPFNDLAARRAFNIPAYLAKSNAEYIEYLHSDTRPWWYEAKPRIKPKFKTKLTNTLRVKQQLGVRPTSLEQLHAMQKSA